MNIALLLQLFISPARGWPSLTKRNPSVAKVFLSTVLPLSLLPPIMLYYAGTTYGNLLLDTPGGRHWGTFSLIFFLAEMLTFAAMGWLIREVAENYDVDIRLRDAYLLAAVSPIPLWLSSLSLFAPSMAIWIGSTLAALIVASLIIYRGIFSLCHMSEKIVAAGIAYSVIAGGGLAWLLLTLMIVLPPL